MQIYEPGPAPQVFGTGPFLAVTPWSRPRVRNQLEGCARMFQRELSFDFAPYCAVEHAYRDAPRQFLIVSPDGRAVGGAGARYREYTGVGHVWGMACADLDHPFATAQGTPESRMADDERDHPRRPPGAAAAPGSAAFFVERTDVPSTQPGTPARS